MPHDRPGRAADVVSGDEAVAAELIGALETERQERRHDPGRGPLERPARPRRVRLDRPRRRPADIADGPPDARAPGLRARPGQGSRDGRRPERAGAGGYEKTPIEETLSVDMGVRSREQQPTWRSSSSSTSRARWTPATATRSTRAPEAGPGSPASARSTSARRRSSGPWRRRRGTRSASWRSTSRPTGSGNTQPLGNVGDLQGAVGGIQPLGTTNIFAGLSEAVKSLEGVTATPAPHHPADRRLVRAPAPTTRSSPG